MKLFRRSATDFTQGSIPKHLMRLAVPLVIGNILQQLYNAIDAFVLARYAGMEEFAAIGVAGAVMNLFLFAIAGACIGLSVLLAQFHGAKDVEGFRNEHFIALASGILFSFAIGISGSIGASSLLTLLSTPPEIFSMVGSYLKIVLLSLPASFIYNFYCALFRSVGRMNVALAILAFAVCLNLALDILFVACFSWGVAGAAWATCLAQAASALLIFFYLKAAFPSLMFRRKNCRLHLGFLRKTAHFAFVTGLQQAGLYIGKLAVQGAVNSMGTATISAYTATMRIEAFANSFGDSAASATSAVAAQNFGAGDRHRLRMTFWNSLFLFGAMGVISSALLWSSAGWASAFLLGESSGPAFDSAVSYLKIVAVFYLLNFTGNTFAGYFDGIGRVSVTLLGTCTHITLRAVLSWVFISSFGLDAVAALTILGWFIVNAIWAFFYGKLCRR
ncbi:MAG: polysaccharide biosynthesis C-terminal domain-containing protein [Mailhella sp.]|nr:polysaccharide biosynthesis C-terminal domain-containing protein [Mailhella sp.]